MIPPALSQRAIDFIISCEVSSRAHYEAALQHPIWPGAQSGITIGVGYDCGMGTAERVRTDWGPHLSLQDVARLANTAGVIGPAALDLVPILADITVPWDAALAVFITHDIPRFADITARAFPNCDLLSGDSFGALVSLVFNRGAGMEGDRRLEMRYILAAMQDRDFAAIPAYIRDMKRLWPGMRGLRDRRDAEAALFEDGLVA